MKLSKLQEFNNEQHQTLKKRSKDLEQQHSLVKWNVTFIQEHNSLIQMEDLRLLSYDPKIFSIINIFPHRLRIVTTIA